MDPVTIGSLVSAGIKGVSSLVKGIKGRKEKKAGEQQMEKAIEDIKYTRPEEYSDIMNILKQRKSSITSRREAAEERVRTQTASSITGISQLADSPVAALGAYGGMKQREQQAIAGIGLEYEERRDEAVMGEVQGLGMGAGYSEKEQYYNEMYKNMVKANLGASKMSAGRNMAWGGFEGVGGAAIDFIGTKYLSNTLNPPNTDPTTDASTANL